MRTGDLAGDVQTEPDSLPALGRGTAERVEDPLAVALRNGRPFVVHRDFDAVRRRREGNAHGLVLRSEEHTSELQSQFHLVCRLLLEKKKKNKYPLLLYIKKKIRQKQ